MEVARRRLSWESDVLEDSDSDPTSQDKEEKEENRDEKTEGDLEDADESDSSDQSTDVEPDAEPAVAEPAIIRRRNENIARHKDNLRRLGLNTSPKKNHQSHLSRRITSKKRRPISRRFCRQGKARNQRRIQETRQWQYQAMRQW